MGGGGFMVAGCLFCCEGVFWWLGGWLIGWVTGFGVAGWFSGILVLSLSGGGVFGRDFEFFTRVGGFSNRGFIIMIWGLS